MPTRIAPFYIALAVALAGCSGGASDPPTVNAERYRVEIEGLDALVFSHRPLNEGGRHVLSIAFSDLSAKFKSLERSRGAAERTRAFRAMSEEVRQDSLSQARIRERWLTLRTEVFGDEVWFTRFDLATGRRLYTRPPHPDELADFDRVLRRFDRLITKGRRDVARLGDLGIDGRTARQDRAVAEAWRDWGESWQADIEEVMRGLPEAPGPGVDRRYRIAYASVGYAAQQLEAAVKGEGALPFQAVVEHHLASAELRLEEAHKSRLKLTSSSD